ncbi:MAG TPA: CPBP family intramembrane glutamic endopeptidase [Streptosporangiaceae bacterium]|nr:CPBP family intramembrane glutamic endopeptidase [Streptosporangiaceae bacterium]
MALTGLVRRWPLACYFGLVYLLSGVALVVIGLPRLDGGGSRSALPLAVFPVMVVGVGLAGIALTVVTGGRQGLRELAARFRRPVPRRWLAVLLIPPAGILAVLGGLSLAVSPRFTPQFFVFGIAAGVVAGFCEEIGWTGFAYPRMRARLGWLGAALLLGLLWGLWHLPVVDSLGAASPHGRYWPAFFAAFIAVLAAIRVLIAWTYVHTGSLRMAQLLHASSTGFLVILSAPRVTPAQEALWYAIYAAVLWAVVVTVVSLHHRLRIPISPRPSADRRATAQ